MQLIIGNDFHKKVIPLIDNARSTISIIVFDWRWYPDQIGNPVQLFNNSLVRAVKRGVDVRSIVNFSSVENILKSVGIKVKHPISKNVIHVKMMIIDNEILIIGSHNYTQNAFTMNHEISVILESCDKIDDLNKFFEGLWLL